MACGGSGEGDAAAASSGSGAANAAAGNGSGAGSGVGGASASGSGGGAPLPVDECASPAAEWVFCSGFEEGSKDIWDDYDGNPDDTNLLMEEGGPFGNAGNHVMRMRVPPDRGGADLVKILPTAHARLHARWYIHYEPGFDFAAPNHGGGLHAGSRDLLGRSDFRPSGSDWFTAWAEHDPELSKHYVYSYYPGMYMDCADPNGSCWGDHFPCMIDEGENYCTDAAHRETVVPPTLETGRWYCVELMLDGGTPTPGAEGANGAIGLAIDGVELGPWSGLWMRSNAELQIGTLWLSLFHHEEHSVEGVLYDHVVVSTEPIGCHSPP